MRILLCIAVSMVHPVHDGISPWIQERRPLCKETEKVEESFCAFAHCEHLMAGITVHKEGLRKQRQKPMS